MLCDFNNKIFNLNRFKIANYRDLSFEPELAQINSDLKTFDLCSIHRLVFLVRHNDDYSVSNTLKYLSAVKDFLKKSIPSEFTRKFKIKVCPLVYFSSDSPYIRGIDRLAVLGRKYIFIELPLSPDVDYLDEALNKILYNCNLLPIFTDFYKYISVYSNETILKLISIKDAVFQFSFDSANSPQAMELMRKIIENDAKVVLGSSLSHEQINKNQLRRSFDLLKRKISPVEYRNLVVSSLSFFNHL